MSCTIVIIINNGYISFISKKKKKWIKKLMEHNKI